LVKKGEINFYNYSRRCLKGGIKERKKVGAQGELGRSGESKSREKKAHIIIGVKKRKGLSAWRKEEKATGVTKPSQGGRVAPEEKGEEVSMKNHRIGENKGTGTQIR